MNRWRAIVFFLVGLLLLVPGVAAAQAADDGDGFVLRIGGTTTVGAGEVLEAVIAIDGDVVIDGTVTGTLWVFDGTATVNGRVEGDVMVVDGFLDLPAGATVENVALIRSDLNRDPGATITGELSERSEFVHFGWGAGIFSTVFWVFSTAALVVAGLVVAAVAGRRLTAAGHELTERAGASVVTALAVWFGLVAAAVLTAITLIGIPIALIIALLVLPALWLIGYVVAGARLGEVLLHATRWADRPERPYLPVAIGLVAFQVIGLIPFVGGLVVGLAGFAGSGALVYRVYRNRRGAREGVALRREPAPTA